MALHFNNPQKPVTIDTHDTPLSKQSPTALKSSDLESQSRSRDLYSTSSHNTLSTETQELLAHKTMRRLAFFGDNQSEDAPILYARASAKSKSGSSKGSSSRSGSSRGRSSKGGSTKSSGNKRSDDDSSSTSSGSSSSGRSSSGGKSTSPSRGSYPRRSEPVPQRRQPDTRRSYPRPRTEPVPNKRQPDTRRTYPTPRKTEPAPNKKIPDTQRRPAPTPRYPTPRTEPIPSNRPPSRSRTGHPSNHVPQTEAHPRTDSRGGYESHTRRESHREPARPRGGHGHHHDHHVHHPRGYGSHGLPPGYWAYDSHHNRWTYRLWDPRDDRYHNYFNNHNYAYDHHHHYYWHNQLSYYDYQFFPRHWDTYVIVLPPSQDNTTPRYEGPKLDVTRLDRLLASKWEIDALARELENVPDELRNSDDYRFKVKQVLDNYHYLLYAVYQHASDNGPIHAINSGPHRNIVYQRAVNDIWQSSQHLLENYEYEFPFDTAMRADSVTVLYSNLAELNLINKPQWAEHNPNYLEIFDQIGAEIEI